MHAHFTRQHSYLHVPITKSNLGKFAIRYRGVVTWNAILNLVLTNISRRLSFQK